MTHCQPIPTRVPLQTMPDSEIWNAFGSDSSSDDDNDDDTKDEHNENQSNISGFHLQQHEVAGTGCNFNLSPSLVAAIDATVLHITSHFLRLSSLSGVSLQDRVVGIGIGIVDSSKGGSCGGDGDDTPLADELVRCRRKYHDVVAERVRGRGMKILDPEHQNDTPCCSCDAAILLKNESSFKGRNEDLSCIKRSVLPGGSLWLILVLDGYVSVKEQSAITTDDNSDGQNIENRMQNILIPEFPTPIWSIVPSSTITSTVVRILHLQKHSCVINAWSCPWMNKMQPPSRRLASIYNETEEYFPIMNSESEEDEYENYLQYERRVASALTIVPSVKERCHHRSCGAATTMTSNNDAPVNNAATTTTILTEEHVQRASELLQKHGLVIIKGLLPPNQTVPWGEAILSDFQLAVSRLKCHPTRPVDLLNPQCTSSGSSSGNPAFEPLSYKEMAMREDLRVDLRSGPTMENLRKVENDSAVHSMMMMSSTSPPQEVGANNGPTMIHADVTGSFDSWRFHPSILAIIKRVFNPRKESFSKGNFGRWNFGGSGPDGSPQPFRLGQIGSVISCPGSADQAIHADTPHLFEHEDCLPCHYLNVFTPGYHVADDPNDDCVEHEFTDDGIWTGNSTIGGTAFVYGSHKLSVSAQLLSEEDNGTGKQDHMMVGSMDNATAISATASMRKKMLWLRTLRPSLEAGDVLIFDCRTIHFGLANTSRGDQSGRNAHAGRRPMLYTNVTQSWFHDPKNWDDREKIF
jgi:hypothetical protein